jgi:FG-GAP-like repeat
MMFKTICRFVFVLLLASAGQSWGQQIAYGTAGMGPDWSRVWIDADGDGRDDFCFLWGNGNEHVRCHYSKSTEIVSTDYGSTLPYGVRSGGVRWLDVNGDGFVDVCSMMYGGLIEPRLVCRRGPDFSSSIPYVVDVPLGAKALNGLTCSGSGDSSDCSPPMILTPGLMPLGYSNPEDPIAGFGIPDFHLADVSGDGIPDLCYFYLAAGYNTDLRCRIATVAPGRTSVTYSAVTAGWTFVNASPGLAAPWPRGFYDFNGDGRADFCRVISGGLRCTISGAGGFVQEVSSVGTLAAPHAHGAAFVDINGDGNVDFCRIDGPAGGYQLRCTMSNGVGWELRPSATGAPGNARERISPNLGDPGHHHWRWWVDVNADGLPDFCRVASSPDPVGNWTHDVTGNLLCRLSRGDGTGTAPTMAFGYSDVTVTGINLGRADGGRAFCDAFGTGIPVLCRATHTTSTTTGAQVCYEEQVNGQTICYNPSTTTENDGYRVGYSDTLEQARYPLLTSFSDGVGADTRITYQSLTYPDAYVRSNTTSNADDRLLLLQPRSPVVFETRAWTQEATPTTLTGNARYMYKDLRTDTWSGSRGFRERWIFNEGSNTLDHVVFFQGLGSAADPGASPTRHDLSEVGLTKCQEKFAVASGLVPNATTLSTTQTSQRMRYLSNVAIALGKIQPIASSPCLIPNQNPSAASPFILLQATVNTLGATTPNNPRFKFAASSTVSSWDWDGVGRIPLPTTTSTQTMDDVGNVLTLTQLTRQTLDIAGNALPVPREWKKETTNIYGQDSRPNWLLGRLTSSTVNAFAPTALVQLGANQSSYGGAANANLMNPPPPPPLPPGVLPAILQLLLD